MALTHSNSSVTPSPNTLSHVLELFTLHPRDGNDSCELDREYAFLNTLNSFYRY